jgi:hypothetical protein
MKEIRVHSISSTGQGLYGITSEGEVVVYLGYKTGWNKLNMNLLSESEAKREWKKRVSKDNKDEESF